MCKRSGLLTGIAGLGTKINRAGKGVILLLVLFFFAGIFFTFDHGIALAVCDCGSCHGTNHHGADWAACKTCHLAPPQTGSHGLHAAPLSNTTYGDTVTSTAGEYRFGCAHCHAMSVTTVADHSSVRPARVELYNPSATGIGKTGTQVCSECHGANGPHGTCDSSDCMSCHNVARGPYQPIVQGTNHHSGACTICHGPTSEDGRAPHDSVPPLKTNASCTSSSCHPTKSQPAHGPGTGVPTACTNCHNPTGITPALDYSNTCAKCHQGGGTDPKFQFTGAQLTATGTAHDGIQTDMDCIQCHTMNMLHRTGDATPGPMTVSSSCKKCHIAGTPATTVHNEVAFDVATGCNQCHNPAIPGAPQLTMDILTSYANGIHLNVPTAEFVAMNSTTTTYVVNFDASLSICPTGLTCTYGWDFGDGGSGTGVTAAHTYADGTARNVTLTVVASSGRSSTKTRSVTPTIVNRAPTASHGPVAISVYTVSFTDTSTDAAGNSPSGIASVSVNWGDGNVLGCTPLGTCSHTYSLAGTYNILQTVTNAAGLSNTAAGFSVTVPQKFTISGRVLEADGVTGINAANMALKLGGTLKAATTSASDGSYSFGNVDPGTYTVNVFKSGITFEQSSIPVTVTASNVTGVDFHAVGGNNGICGTSNGGTFTTAPSMNLCSAGTPTAVTSNPDSYTWSCLGSGGSNANCSATRAYTVTPSANTGGSISPNTAQTVAYNLTQQFTVTPDSGYTAAMGGTCGGTPTGGTSQFTYTTNLVTADCTVTATFTPNPVNGQCGPANGQAFNTAPSTNLCSAGTPSAVSGSGPWTWTCAGVYGGTTASCSANIQYALNITSAGTGTGRVTGAGNYLTGAIAHVTVAVDANSIFEGWSGDCLSYGTATSFDITMTQATNCTATFTLNPAITNPVRLNSNPPYATLQEALNLVSSDTDVIMVMSGKYDFGSVVFDKPNTLTLKGGYDAGFMDNATGAYTTISGITPSLTIRQGTVTIENIVIK